MTFDRWLPYALSTLWGTLMILIFIYIMSFWLRRPL